MACNTYLLNGCRKWRRGNGEKRLGVSAAWPLFGGEWRNASIQWPVAIGGYIVWRLSQPLHVAAGPRGGYCANLANGWPAVKYGGGMLAMKG